MNTKKRAIPKAKPAVKTVVGDVTVVHKPNTAVIVSDDKFELQIDTRGTYTVHCLHPARKFLGYFTSFGACAKRLVEHGIAMNECQSLNEIEVSMHHTVETISESLAKFEHVIATAFK